MTLDAYFERIGYAGATAPDHETLRAVMRAHVAAIPFENLDVQLGRQVSGAIEDIFAKLVSRRRGGWCYEQNGLLGWALERLGFEVVRIAAGVMRIERGEAALGNHLALLVTLEGRQWLVDAGFGGSLAEPIPLEAGAHRHLPYTLSLARLDDGYWRFEEQDGGAPFSFDFRAEPADPALLARQQASLQTHAESPFTLNLVAQRRSGEAHASLRGRVLRVLDADGHHETLLEDADALVETLRARFDLDLPEARTLWPCICERHEAVFGPLDKPKPLP